MAAPYRSRRRDRYAARAHDVATKPTFALSPATFVPETIAWKVRPGDDVAHAYSTGPGFMRSVCRRERWTVLWHDAPEDVARCFECADLVAGVIPEGELRAMDGNR